MNLDVESATRRFPSLVQLCQRVASVHVDHISSIGDELTYQLAQPILERCDAEQLLRLEESSPHLQEGTPEIWKNLCYSIFSLSVDRYITGFEDEARSWKDYYFFLRENEMRRLEEASTKLRNQRLEAEERKKEREVKITDDVPPPKRQRTWSTNPQPKSLFQKTRSEASKLQKSMYHTRVIPPMPNGKTFRVLPKPPDAALPFPSSSVHASRVTVNTVIHHRPALVSIPSSTSTIPPTPGNGPPLSLNARPTIVPSISSSPPVSSPKKPPIPPPSVLPPEPRPLKPQAPTKRDPMSALFVPKRRAYSQRP